MNNKRKCLGCGREQESEILKNRQNIKKANLRTQKMVGDKVTLESDWGIVDEGSTGIISKFVKSTEEDVDQYAEVAFNPYKPFDLERLEEYGKLSISGGPIKRIPVKYLKKTTEIEKTAIHKHSPKMAGQTPPQVIIYSKVWEFEPGDLE